MPLMQHPLLDVRIERNERKARVLMKSGWTEVPTTEPPADEADTDTDTSPDDGAFSLEEE